MGRSMVPNLRRCGFCDADAVERIADVGVCALHAERVQQIANSPSVLRFEAPANFAPQPARVGGAEA